MSTRPLPSAETFAGDIRTEAGIRRAWLAHGPELRACAFRSLRDRGLAEDALQETFLRAWRKRDDFDAARGSLRTWLYAIMRNLLVDMARARAARPRTSPAVPDAPAAEELDGHLGSLAVAEALRRLTPEHRQVILQNYLTQRPQSEIAEFLAVPVGTVRRLFCARDALSRALLKIGVLEPALVREPAVA